VTHVARVLSWSAVLLAAAAVAWAQEVEVERPAPPALEDFESDKNGDGVPDGWYNARDAVIAPEGGKVGPHCLRFETRKPGRPSRLSRAFGVDGRKTEALIIGMWIRADQLRAGERLGEDPGLLIDFLGDGLRTLRRGLLGPWNKSIGPHWTRVAKRIPVPPGTRDAIMSIGLIGATGVLEIDGMTIDLVPVGGQETTNLVINGDFELGDPTPFGWGAEGGAHRTFPGFNSDSAVELAHAGSRVLTGLGVPVEPFGQVSVTARVRAQGLRGGGGAGANLYFVNAEGQPLPGAAGAAPVFRWAGTFDWQPEREVVRVPDGAVRAVLQFEKADSGGWVRIDDVAVVSAPNPMGGAWVPYHVDDDTTGWPSVRPSPKIEAGSALDASFLLDAPAGKKGFVTVRGGRLHFSKGGRARFFGVFLLPPAAFLDRARADALADRLARSGVNLVRLGDLDTPLGPVRSLFEDSRDDTQAFDPAALARLDHLIAALKARGIYVALELQSVRRFRSEDGVADPGALPPGGGPAAEFDPVIKRLALESARNLLSHVNPETGLALRDDPVLAWVTLGGEISLFDQIDNPNALPPDHAAALRALAARNTGGTGRRLWQNLGGAHWREMADALRKSRVKAPIAGVSHWRREVEFSATQATAGLDLIDDRLYWLPPPWAAPDRRSLLWSADGALAAGAARKRKTDRPYVVGQWCHQTSGAWALPYEAADTMLASEIATAEDWDALVRRGIFIHPDVWGTNSAGTGGVEDIFQIAEVVNGLPQVYAVWPHAASVLLRNQHATAQPAPPHRAGARHRNNKVAGWDPGRGRLLVDTPYTQGLAGWVSDEPAVLEHIVVEVDSPYAVVLASSATAKPIATTNRLLVTAVARVEPTGLTYVDQWKREVADPGRPPLLQEPVRAKVLWRKSGKVKAYALDNTGARTGPARTESTADGVQLSIDGSLPVMHWEMLVE
jgi:hypothetical protein